MFQKLKNISTLLFRCLFEKNVILVYYEVSNDANGNMELSLQTLTYTNYSNSANVVVLENAILQLQQQ
jgi:hypothetical protein